MEANMAEYTLDCGFIHKFTLDVDKRGNPSEGREIGYPKNYKFPATSIRDEFDAAHYTKYHGAEVSHAISTGLATSAFDHFMKFGACNGYSPSPKVDNQCYLANNPDLRIFVQGCPEIVNGMAKERSTGIEHYLVYGRIEALPENFQIVYDAIKNIFPPEVYSKHTIGSRALTSCENKLTSPSMMQIINDVLNRLDKLDTNYQKLQDFTTRTFANQQDMMQNLIYTVNDVKNQMAHGPTRMDQELSSQLNELLTLVAEHHTHHANEL
jgi:hypothetical protein